MRRKRRPQERAVKGSARRQRRKWLAAVSCMAAMVVFCTVYALVMPAVTLEGETYCGMEEHTHDESCMGEILSCGLEEDGEHIHDESCYEEGVLCQLAEHTHSEACFVNLDETEEAGADETEVTETEETETLPEETNGEPETEETESEMEAAEESENGDASDTENPQASETPASQPDGAQVPDGYTQRYTVRHEANGFAVTVYAPKGGLPEDAVLSAELLSEGDSAYAAAGEALAAQVADEASARSGDGGDTEPAYGFAALDIHFENTDGDEIEPEGDVYVVIDAEGLLPEEADPESVTVQHHAEQNGAVNVETVADAANETGGLVAVTGQTDVQTAFAVESFSTFTIYWNNNNGLTVQIIDASGNSIGNGSIGFTSISSTTSIDAIVERIASQSGSQLDGYTFSRAVVAGNAGSAINSSTEVLRIRRSTSGWSAQWQYSTQASGNNWNRINNTLYLIYDEIPTGSVKVYVYVAGTGLSDECLELLGIDKNTLDGNGYFPAGEITLDASYFTGKAGANTPGVALINSNADWQQLLAALGEMDTSTLADQRNWNYSGANYSGKKDYSVNQGNHVGDYLSQARGDIGYTWGSQHTALFRWHNDPSQSGNAHYGFADQTVKYHLDLFFTTNKIDFILGNNGIIDRWENPNAYDGLTVDTRTYITGSEIQPPRNLNIPDGYYFDGYYEDANFTTPWNGIGTPLNADEKVYIKLSKNPVLALTITKEVTGTRVEDKTYTFTISTMDSNVADESYRTSTGGTVTFTDEDGDGTYTATVTLTASSQNGVDGTVLIYGLPTGRNTAYTVTEDETSAVISGYRLDGITYTINGISGNTVTTGAGAQAITSATAAVTNSYVKAGVDITVIKVDSTTPATKLPGAEFYLSKTADSVKTFYAYNTENQTVAWVDSTANATRLTSDENGQFILHELEDGSYTLEEMKAPNGYKLPETDFTFTVANGVVSYVSSGTPSMSTTVTVSNTTGAILPETGGAGTTHMAIGGLLCMAAAVGGGYGLRRRRGREGR